jgi:hypothetical protein
MFYLAFRLKYIDEIKKNEGISQCSEIGKILNGLIRKLSNPQG